MSKVQLDVFVNLKLCQQLHSFKISSNMTIIRKTEFYTNKICRNAVSFGMSIKYGFNLSSLTLRHMEINIVALRIF